ncbi:MAG: dihydroorotase [Bacteroidia bacterium]
MRLLIKNITVVDPNSDFNNEKIDILIDGETVKKAGKSIKADDKIKVFEGKGLFISPGWFDMQANFRDPGEEYKEDIYSGIEAAISGGFTGVALMPSTQPSVSSKSQVQYIIKKSAGVVVDVFPIGTLSVGREGNDISEMYDMHTAGAVAFSDDKRPVADSGLLTRALMYTKSFNGLIITFPEDKGMTALGMVNESAATTALGFKGAPALAEELQLDRDLQLAEYTQAKLHISLISSAESAKKIKEARKKGLAVTAGVSAHHLVLNDKQLEDFDSNYKVKPPLRSEKDNQQLIKALADGTIDVVVSDHSPEDEEHKNCEFDYASFGIIGLQTVFPILNTYVNGKIGLEKIIEKIAINPRKILGLSIPSVKEGSKANFTIFDTKVKWTYTKESIKSKSFNSPFIGHEFTGKAVAVINNGQFIKMTS